MRKFMLACALVAMPTTAIAGTKDFALQGYALPQDKPVTIVMMRPDVDVGELQGGGMAQPNADWTEAARKQVSKALEAYLKNRQIDFRVMEVQQAEYRANQAELAAATCNVPAVPVPVAPTSLAPTMVAADGAAMPTPEPASADTPAPEPAALPAVLEPACSSASTGDEQDALIADYEALHEAVIASILAHKYGLGDGKLPTQKDKFAYSLGPGTAELGKFSGANYGLFVMTYDQFASASRKAMQVVGALGCIIGACVIVGGGVHVAYVSLVELETGNIVWFNVLRGSKGDVREAEGAVTMVDAIMAGMPTRPGQMAAPTTDVAAK